METLIIEIIETGDIYTLTRGTFEPFEAMIFRMVIVGIISLVQMILIGLIYTIMGAVNGLIFIVAHIKKFRTSLYLVKFEK